MNKELAVQPALLFESFYGLGDCFYERPFLLQMAKRYERVYVKTHFPEIYHDQPDFIFVKPDMNVHLKLQIQNASRFKSYIERPPERAEKFSFRKCQDNPELPCLSRFDSYFKYVSILWEGLSPLDFSFPLRADWIKAARDFICDLGIDGETYCIFRPPTIQKGFSFPGRFADPLLYETLWNIARQTVSNIINVGNCDPAYEAPMWGISFPVEFDFTKGEIDIWTLIALMKYSSFNIAGPSNFLSIGLSLSVPTFILYGASPRENPLWQIPGWLFDGAIGFARAPFYSYRDKKVLEWQFNSWLSQLTKNKKIERESNGIGKN